MKGEIIWLIIKLLYYQFINHKASPGRMPKLFIFFRLSCHLIETEAIRGRSSGMAHLSANHLSQTLEKTGPLSILFSLPLCPLCLFSQGPSSSAKKLSLKSLHSALILFRIGFKIHGGIWTVPGVPQNTQNFPIFQVGYLLARNYAH